jgi:hypothetical protein
MKATEVKCVNNTPEYTESIWFLPLLSLEQGFIFHSVGIRRATVGALGRSTGALRGASPADLIPPFGL